jgi:hypothetical protein
MGLSNLVKLHMQYNAVSYIPKKFFSYTPQLLHINLRNNNIKSLKVTFTFKRSDEEVEEEEVGGMREGVEEVGGLWEGVEEVGGMREGVEEEKVVDCGKELRKWVECGKELRKWVDCGKELRKWVECGKELRKWVD